MADTKENVVPLTAGPENEMKPNELPSKTEPGAELPLTEEPKETKPDAATADVLPLTDADAQNNATTEPSTTTEPGAALPLTEGPESEKKADEAKDEPKDEPQDIPASEDGWPVIKANSPLAKFLSEYPALVKEADYDEVYGLHLTGQSFHTKLILQKYLRANANDVTKAKAQLLGTLKWRKEFQPTKTLEDTYEGSKFGGLGFVTTLNEVPTDGKAVATFNLYGAVKDNKATFGDLDSFIRWRVALMELSLQKLDLASAKEPIPDYGAGPDPYQAYQIHDYMNVSFLRQDPHVKAASKKTIDLMSKYYPETLSRKFFVNVPAVMGWMFTAVKLVLAKETVRKFTVMSYGNALAAELGPEVPEQYGGKGEALDKQGVSPKQTSGEAATA